jgi:hypothetical protein
MATIRTTGLKRKKKKQHGPHQKTKGELSCSQRVSSACYKTITMATLTVPLIIENPMLPLSLDYPFLIAPSLFSNIY